MTKTATDVRDLIFEVLKKRERTYAWLARQTDISYSTLYHCLSKKWFELSEENLKKINAALGTSFKAPKK